MRIRGSLMVALLLTAILAACAKPAAPAPPANRSNGEGASPKTEPYSPLSYKGTDRMEKLLAGAKAEGKVTFYTSLAGEVVQKLSEAFKAEYGIEVTVFRAAENNVVTRMVQEDQARKNTVDVVELTMGGALDLQEMKLVQPFYSPAAEQAPAEYVMPAEKGQFWGASERVSYILFSYNQKELPATLVPKSFSDLLNPGLKGKLAVASSTTGVRWVGAVMEAMGDAKGREFLEQLSKQNVRVESVSGAALMDLVAQGQVASAPTIFIDHVNQQKEKKAPVDWVALDLVVSNVGMTMVGTKAPNTHAAVLFVDWILAGNGRKVLEANGYVHGSVPQPYTRWVPEKGLTASQYRAKFDQWQALFEKTFR